MDRAPDLSREFRSMQKACFPELEEESASFQTGGSKRSRDSSKSSAVESPRRKQAKRTHEPDRRRVVSPEILNEGDNDRSLSMSPEPTEALSEMQELLSSGGGRAAKNVAMRRLSNEMPHRGAATVPVPKKCFCKLCQRDIFASQKAHIYLIHLKKPRFRCPHCKYSNSYRREAVLAHIEEGHGGLGGPIDGRDELTKEARKWASKCFGMLVITKIISTVNIVKQVLINYDSHLCSRQEKKSIAFFISRKNFNKISRKFLKISV